MSSYSAFLGTRLLATGSLADVAVAAHLAAAERPADPILTFDDATGRVTDLDLRGGDAAIRARYGVPPEPPALPRGRGRPRLGVVPREVTLLPRHWEWLAAQPGGASVALRKLVEEARRAGGDADEQRRATERTYRFLSTMAGNFPDFEEASRALFANDRDAFMEWTREWPADVRAYAGGLLTARED